MRSNTIWSSSSVGLINALFIRCSETGVDRKKSTRKIEQLKKKLSQDGLSSKERKSLEAQLLDKRVDLYYTLVHKAFLILAHFSC